MTQPQINKLIVVKLLLVCRRWAELSITYQWDTDSMPF